MVEIVRQISQGREAGEGLNGLAPPDRCRFSLPCRCKVSVAPEAELSRKKQKDHTHTAFQGRWTEVKWTKSGRGRDEGEVAGSEE